MNALHDLDSGSGLGDRDRIANLAWPWKKLTSPRSRQTVYLSVVIGAGILVILTSVRELRAHDGGLLWLVLTGLTVLGGAATLRLPNVAASFSISDSFTIATALLFGPAAGAVTVAIDSLVISYNLARRNFGVWRLLFNATAPALAMWTAAKVFFGLTQVEPLIQPAASVTPLLLPLVLFTALYFMLNTGLIAGAIALEQRVAVIPIWRQHFLPLWLTSFGGAAVAALLIALNWRGGGLTVLALVAPIPLILYASFKTAVGRIEDQFAHFGQVNRMYLATIEALATALEAKDGVTHDHIRRVQTQAIRLARELGVTDDPTIRAIEAAALLHDIGKLAVPEHILNKPGKLTAAEYDQMKLHVEVGADILSAIDFPYPVVPIVRCHHEQWDGNGYPHGLKGEEIPIGARILSVIDCYDALTSDRPYRLALSERAAMEIVLDRRGTMYDPSVVDMFATMNREYGSPMPSTIPHQRALTRMTSGALPRPAAPPVVNIDASDDVLAVVSLSRVTSDQSPPAEVASLTATLVRRVIPGATCAFYLLSGSDELVLRHVAGPLAAPLRGMKMRINQRLSGWVAAHRQTILNSDAALDLADLDLGPGERTCLSVPLLDGEALVGVLTLYAEAPAIFTEEQGRVMQMLAPHLARIMTRMADSRVPVPLPPTNAAAAGEARAHLSIARTTIDRRAVNR